MQEASKDEDFNMVESMEPQKDLEDDPMMGLTINMLLAPIVKALQELDARLSGLETQLSRTAMF